MKLFYTLILFLLFFNSCNSQDKNSQKRAESKDSLTTPKLGAAKPPAQGTLYPYGPNPDPALQVSQYIRRMHQDRNGNIWFGTNGDGICRYDGKNFVYFTNEQAFGGNAVRGIVEDEKGNIWFATSFGISRYTINKVNNSCNKLTCGHDLQIPLELKEHKQELSKLFTNYNTSDGLAGNQVWSILLDKKGDLWFGTEGGVSRFDGKTMKEFPIPESDLKNFPDAYPAPKLINSIYQDKSGIIWFGSNGNGVYRYDGTNLTNLSEKDGLCNNFVQCIREDRNGVLWFGSRFGGLSLYDGKSFTNYSINNGLAHNFIWIFLEDRKGKMWIGSAGGSLFEYDGHTFTNYTQRDGLNSRHVQSLLEDKNGQIWVGTSGGVYRLKGKTLYNFTKENAGQKL